MIEAIRGWIATWAARTHSHPPTAYKRTLGLELLEGREVPAAPLPPIVVTTTANDGAGSLRAAIVRANLNPGHDTILFDLPGGPIEIDKALPTIIDSVTIDARNGVTLTVDPAVMIPAGLNGLVFGRGMQVQGGVNRVVDADGSKVYGLTIKGFSSGAGILLDNVSDCLIGLPSNGGVNLERNEVGLHVQGLLAQRNTLVGSTIRFNKKDGVLLDQSSAQTFVGLLGAERNWISANTNTGIRIVNSNDNVLAGNLIGTDVEGAEALKAGVNFLQRVGVSVSGDSVGNQIGADVPLTVGVFTPANLISGNRDQVVLRGEQVKQTSLRGNYIGTNLGGDAIISSGPGRTSVMIDSADATKLGGPDTVAAGKRLTGRNIIVSDGDESVNVNSASNTRIVNNYINSDLTGTILLVGAATRGIRVFDSAGTTIGRDLGAGRDSPANVILGGATGTAIKVETDNTGTRIMGNFVGVGSDGKPIALSVEEDGTRVTDEKVVDRGILILSSGTEVGGIGKGMGNVIGGTITDGIFVGPGIKDTWIRNNRIGVGPGGTMLLNNGWGHGRLLSVPA